MSAVRAIKIEEPGKLEHFSTAQESPGPGEALVRTGFVGMCGTDFHAFHGTQAFFTYPRIIGHELGVTVLTLGPDTEASGLRVGDKCAVEPYYNCQSCVACKRGKDNCCVSLKVIGVHIDGGLRDTFVVPVRKLHRSESLPLDTLALVETLCIGAHAVNRGQVEPRENVLVVGAGPVGMGAAQFAMADGGNVLVLDVVDSRLDFVRHQIGVHQTLNAFKDGAPQPTADVVEAIKAVFGGDLPTLVFECTGNLRSMKGSFEYVAHGGRLVFVGHTKEEVSYHNPLFHSRELTIMGSRNALGSDFRKTIGLIEAGKIDVKPWLTHRSTYDNFDRDFAVWQDPASGCIKGLVDMSS